MDVFILEDDLFQQLRIKKIILSLIHDKKYLVNSIKVTSKPSFLLKAVQESVSSNIYFVDIKIGKNRTAGLEIAQKIRAIDKEGIITFVTTHSEFAPITYKYKVSAFDFIDKNYSDEAIYEHLYESFLARSSQDESHSIPKELFIFENKNSSFQVPISEILYFETTENSHKLRLVCKNRIITFYSSISEIASMNDNFFLCHRSFVINTSNLVEIDKKNDLVFFSQGYSCPITRRKIKPLLEFIKQKAKL